LNSCSKKEDTKSDKEKAVDLVIYRTLRAIEKKYDLYFGGSGGRMMYNVKMIAIAFDSHKPIKVNKARELVVACTEQFLKGLLKSEEKNLINLVKYKL